MNRHDHLCPAACECGACAPICECALIARTRAEERSTDTRDLTIAALRDQVATLRAETIRLEHLLDSLRRPARPGITHLCPPDGSPLTPCCAKLPFELPSTDRLTLDPSQVTCRESEQPPNVIARNVLGSRSHGNPEPLDGCQPDM